MSEPIFFDSGFPVTYWFIPTREPWIFWQDFCVDFSESEDGKE